MAFIPAVLMTVGIAVLSLMESRQMPAVHVSDKLVHAIMYGLLEVSVMGAFVVIHRACTPYFILTCVGATLYGALLEILQHYCTLTRTGDWMDLLADFIGALLGVILVALVNFIMTTRSRDHVTTINHKS